MRTTVLTKADARRIEPYSANFHGLLKYEGGVETYIESLSNQEILVRFKLDFSLVEVETKKLFGTVQAEAETTVSGFELPVKKKGKQFALDEAKLTEEFLRLLEGALAEDVLIPLSVLARGMKLPSLLPIPRIFPRAAKAVRA